MKKMKVIVELGSKRWLRSNTYRATANVIELCEGIYIVETTLEGARYLFPVMRCSCRERDTVKINGTPYCEAEYCSDFLEKISRCDGINITAENPAFRRFSVKHPIAEDATNPHILLSSNGEDLVLKGYRLYTSWNPEPLFLHFLSDKQLTPRLKLSYSYKGSPLGILTEFIKGAIDPGSILYSSLVRTLTGEGLIVPLDDIKAASQTIARFHNVMLSCTENWCTPRTANETDVDRWRKRTLFYLSNILKFEPSQSIKRILLNLKNPLFDEFIDQRIIATHQDLHFSQMLKWGENLFIIDFEGEPGRPDEYRRDLEPPLRDLASTLRALSYIAFFALLEVNRIDKQRTMQLLYSNSQQVELAREWTIHVAEKLIEEYARYVKRDIVESTSPSEILEFLKPWFVERALYEAYYESGYRPENTMIALSTLANNIPPILDAKIIM
ncbi:MAG: hypothetical protein ACP5II_04715 [Infirmifilum sp.]